MEKYDITKLKENLKKERKEQNKTQKEVIEGVKNEIGLKALQNIESTKNNIVPDFATIIALCNYYNCDLDYLFGIMDFTTHDNMFISNTLGVKEKTIKRICSLSEKQKILLEIILNNSKLLDLIETFADLENINDLVLKTPLRLGKIDATLEQTISMDDNTTLFGVRIKDKDLFRRAYLDKIKTELEGISSKYYQELR